MEKQSSLHTSRPVRTLLPSPFTLCPFQRPFSTRRCTKHKKTNRYEDISEPSQLAKTPQMDRTIAFYGYVRGCNFRESMKFRFFLAYPVFPTHSQTIKQKKLRVHICGAGDFEITKMEEMEDPVPLPTTRMRQLVKQGKVYAPMANLGPVVFDKHVAYITLKDPKRAEFDDKKQFSWEVSVFFLLSLSLAKMINGV